MVKAKSVPKGYKKTEVGVIPEDWEVKRVGEVGIIKRGASPRPIEKYLTDDPNGICWIRIGDADKSGIIKDTEQKVTYEAKEKSVVVNRGDLLLSNSMSYGRPYMSKIDGCIHDGWLRIREKFGGLDKKCLYYFLASNKSKEFFSLMSAGSGVQNLNKEVVSKLLIPLPPLQEQKAIAKVLSDVDELIASIEKLINKKQNIKQGTMQLLLTGKKRLPGFTGEWEVKQVGDVLKVKHGKSQHQVATEDGQYPILATGGEIGRADQYLFNKPSVLIGRKGTIDRPQYVETPFWTIDTLFYTDIYNDSEPKYIYYLFSTIDWYSYNEASGVPSLNASTIEKINISLPPLPEQKAIAQILSDMDAEIEALEKKLQKYKLVKEGMMEKLLTGKVRLV